jgi:hypothetical protein
VSESTWTNARRIDRPSGTWELLGDDVPCATVDGVRFYWCALRRIGAWRNSYNAGPMRRRYADAIADWAGPNSLRFRPTSNPSGTAVEDDLRAVGRIPAPV